MKQRQAEVIEEGEYYHVYTRGTRKHEIFHDERDYVRFIFLLLYSHGTYYPANIHRQISYFLRDRTFRISSDDLAILNASRMAEVNVFGLMPNHLHLILKEVTEGGISKLMQRVLNAYAKYYNEKYKETGHLFQGRFGRIHIEDNRQFLHTSAYIHRNPRELKGWANREYEYPWSSLQDYVGTNRWNNLLEQSAILEQFNDSDDYREFVKTSPAKEH